MKKKVSEKIEYSTENENPVITNFNLESVIDFYHKKLYESKEALDHLEKVGLKNQSNYERFKLGFANGTILEVISKKQKEELTKFDLLNDNAEYFYNCITIPILDESEKINSIHGFNINTNNFLK